MTDAAPFHFVRGGGSGGAALRRRRKIAAIFLNFIVLQYMHNTALHVF
jgi:hypothetical protein